MINKAEYMVAFINEFAQKHSLSDVQAFKYLDRFNAIAMVVENYDIAHTLSFNDVVDGVTAFCHRNGGRLI